MIVLEAENRVSLEIFEGPLDLLLYLIKKDEVDIYEVSIERITDQYLEYIDTFKILNIELASEFIVMAANLMYIKSRTLLPRNEQAPEEDIDEEDPRWELIRQLVEYKKFKDAANYLEKREVENQKFYSAEQQFCDDLEEEGEPIVNVGIFELIQAFQGVLKRFDDEDDLTEIADDRFTVSDKIDYLITNVSKGQKVKFYQLFEEASTKSEVLVTFLALLELIRLNEFQVRQNGILGEIELSRTNLDEI
ncbi:MAG: chromosome segregation protein ScpA [Verrucomicrobiales bacterium]|nr:chromosome segregation protein ScpA [Verrucomicrobiales bacterium]MBE86133.1 chromosome segregation protein ScpA [Verrucomicrobiales bacterium]